MCTTRTHRLWRGAYAALLIALLTALTAAIGPAPARADNDRGNSGLTPQQSAVLYGIARDTWNFYRADVDPNTHLPLDNLGYTNNEVTVRGAYTSAANVGVYL